MAIDEVLLESVKKPSIRFYRWDHPALSFGYFGKFEEVSGYIGRRDIVRRWTGGGIVLHGEDLTYALVIPENHSLFRQPPTAIYRMAHRALCDVLQAGGHPAELVPVAAVYQSRRSRAKADDRRKQLHSAVIERACFSNPVRADVMINGRKVAGAAQRRTRRGLLQQGSIQNVELTADFVACLIDKLSPHCSAHELTNRILERASEVAEQKYATPAWLERR